MLNKLPSLQVVYSKSLDTVKKFPLVLSMAFVGTFTALLITKYELYELGKELVSNYKLIQIVISCYLGMILFLAIDLFYTALTFEKKIPYYFVGTLLLAANFSFQLNDLEASKTYYLQIIYSLGLHLLVSFTAFTQSGSSSTFWQFNKLLFIRFLTATLYSTVLFLGLSLALLAVDNLLGVSVDSKIYLQLWIVIAGGFNTCFFLAGVPDNPKKELEFENSYPKGLKIFTQYVLLPLVTIYLIILYAYTIKLLINWSLPKGWVSYMVIAYSVFGILSFLLVYPIRNIEENKWINIYSKWFYRAILPLVILLLIAIGVRIIDYGFTEKRYFTCFLAVWLAFIAGYFLFSKNKNIKIIPISLCIITFLSSFGPWGAFSVSENSQVNRLEKVLIKNEILVDGKIKTPSKELKSADKYTVISILRYLQNNHDFKKLERWYTVSLDELANKNRTMDTSLIRNNKILVYYHYQAILKSLNIDDYGYGWESDVMQEIAKGGPFRYYVSNNRQAKNVQGYSYISYFSIYNYDNTYSNYLDSIIIKQGCRIAIQQDSITKTCLKIGSNGNIISHISLDSLLINASKYTVRNSHQSSGISIADSILTVKYENELVKIKIGFNDIAGNVDSLGKKSITQMNGDLYIHFKKE